MKKKMKKLKKKTVKKYFIDTLLGLEYIHYQQFLHMDLKPDNLLINEAGDIKIADFGQSMAFESSDKIKREYGTPAYSAPESFDGNEYPGKKADIWALGITIWTFLFGETPFKGNNLNEISKNIKKDKLNFSARKDLSEECVQLLNALLEKDFIKRPSIKDIKTFKWIKDDKSLRKYDNNKNINFIHNPEMETINKEKELLKIKEHKRIQKSNSIINKSFTSVSEAEVEMSPKQLRELKQLKKKKER